MSFLVGEIAAKLTADPREFNKRLDQAKKSGEQTTRVIADEFSKIGKSMQSTGSTLTKRLTLPLVGFGALALRTAGNFEASMNRVAAISGATGSQLQQMTELARELGATTQFSASQAADAMSFLSMAGFDVNQTMTAMPAVLNLAAAAQLDMAQSADIASNIMAGFNMDASELSGAVDVLAKSFTSSNTDLSQLGEAMKMVGPVASGFGVQFEETAAAVGFLSDAGMQASMAGTGLRRILTTLSREADKLGVEVYDSSGRMRSLADIMTDLERTGLSSARAMEIFGDRGGPAMQVLLSRGSDALREMTGELQDAGGTAERIAKQQMEGLNGALKELQSAFEELQLAIADAGLIDFGTDAVRVLARITQAMGDLHPMVTRMGVVMGGFLAIVGPGIYLMGGFVRALGALTVATGAQTTAQIALNRAMKANVFIGITALVVSYAASVASAAEETKKFREELDELLSRETGADDFDELNQKIIEQSQKIEQAERNFNRYGSSSKAAIRGQRAEIDKMNADLQKLIEKRNQAAAERIQKVIDERSEEDVDDTTEAVERLTMEIRRAKVEAERPTGGVIDPEGLLQNRDSLSDLLDLKLELGEPIDLEFPEGSLGSLQERMTELREQMLYAFDPEVQQRLREEMEMTQEQIDDIMGKTEQAAVRGREFGNIMGNALSQAVLHGNDLSDVLKNLIKQFASRAFVMGVTALVTGGASLGGGSLLGAVFGGLFHSGGIVPGSGERMIQVRGGEGVFTRSQMKAMGRMQAPAQSVDPAQMERAFAKALRSHTSRLGPDEFFMLTEKGRRQHA